MIYALLNLSIIFAGHFIQIKSHTIVYAVYSNNELLIYNLWADRPNQLLVDSKPIEPMIMADITSDKTLTAKFNVQDALFTFKELRELDDKLLTKICKTAVIQNGRIIKGPSPLNTGAYKAYTPYKVESPKH
jgi:hypothetical protein